MPGAGRTMDPAGGARRLLAPFILAALILPVGLVLTAAPALASCIPPRPIEESLLRADVVVVGMVTHIENGGRWITVRVEERWRAPESLPEVIAVRGGPEPGTATSVDRVFVPGRYLFFLTGGPGYFVDNACTATTAWTDELAAHRPPGVSPAPNVVSEAPPGPLDQVDLWPVAALSGALLIALVSYGFILRGRRRPPDWMR